MESRIRRASLKSHALAVITAAVGQNGRHELGGEMGLAPGRTPRHLRIRSGMRLGEAVARKGGHQFPDASPTSGGMPLRSSRAGNELLFQVLHLFARVKMRHGAPQQVGICQAETGDRVGDAQHLFLVEDDAEGVLQERLEGGVKMLHLFFPLETAHKGIL